MNARIEIFAKKAKNLKSYKITFIEGFGGLMTNNLPLICGSLQNSMAGYCYALGEDYFVDNKMIEPRYDGASTVLNDEVLWITGGKSKLIAGTRVFV